MMGRCVRQSRGGRCSRRLSLLLCVLVSLARVSIGDITDQQAVYIDACARAWGVPANVVENGANYDDYSGMVTSLDVPSSNLQGPLPPALFNLVALTWLGLSNNSITGSIPAAITDLLQLQYLDLSYNYLSSSLPSELGGLAGLSDLHLNGNQLAGLLPTSLSNLVSATHLDLSYNSFAGTIPTGLATLSFLKELNLDYNRLIGTVPRQLSQLTILQELTLNSNTLTGVLPPVYGMLTHLTLLAVPKSVRCPASNTSCVVSQTASSAFCRLCRAFCSTCKPKGGGNNSPPHSPPQSPSPPPPPSSSKPQSSPFPSLPTPAPSPPPPPPPPSPSPSSSLPAGAIAGIVVGVVVALLAAGIAAFLLWARRGRGREGDKNHGAEEVGNHGGEKDVEEQQALKAVGKTVGGASGGETGGTKGPSDPQPSFCARYSLQQMQVATDDWSKDNILGSGAFGTVYKAHDVSNPSVPWAVKRAKLHSNDFRKEVEAVAVLRHPCIVRLLGYCVDFDPATETYEQIMVYEFVPNGDLKQFQAQHKDASLAQRLDILRGVARGLEYLHSNGIVHRDIKPANVLLDKSWQPKIADFGLLREMEGSTVHMTAVVGTPGYVDPAYVSSSIALPSTDVYSFGIVMLEMLTGHNSSMEGNMSASHIKHWAESRILSHDITSFKDPQLKGPEKIIQQLAELALSCTSAATSSRPQMRNIVADLEAIKMQLVGREPAKFSDRVDEQIKQSSDVLSLEDDLKGVSLDFQ